MGDAPKLLGPPVLATGQYYSLVPWDHSRSMASIWWIDAVAVAAAGARVASDNEEHSIGKCSRGGISGNTDTK